MFSQGSVGYTRDLFSPAIALKCQQNALPWALSLLIRPLNFYIGHFNVVYDLCISCIMYSKESTWSRTCPLTWPLKTSLVFKILCVTFCQKSIWSRPWTFTWVTLILYMDNWVLYIKFFFQESTWSKTWTFMWVMTWPSTHRTSTTPISACWVAATPCPPPSPVSRNGSTTPWPPLTLKVVDKS